VERNDCEAYIRKVSRIMDVLQGKWRLEILCAMRYQPVRLSKLVRLLPLASKKALRANLRIIESARIVSRRDLSNSVLHVEYDFQDGMREVICSLLDDIAAWGDMLETKKVYVKPPRI
jgi:DNA-binding HxlR family transcriptional regulator